MGIFSAISRFIPARPRMEVSALGPRVQLFCIPSSQLRRLPKSSGFAAFTNETGWLARGSSLAIKDHMDFRSDDKVRAMAPISPGSAVSIAVSSLPANHLIVGNIYDERNIATAESFAAGFDAVAEQLIRLGGSSLALPDPTDDWNYSEKRVDADFAADLLVSGIVRNRKRLKTFRIVVTNERNLAAYMAKMHYLNENAWRHYGDAAA